MIPRHRVRAALARFAQVFRSDQLNERLEAEVRFHLEMTAEKEISRGLSPQRAEFEALQRFGGRDRWKEEARDATRSRVVADAVSDLKIGARTLRQRPAFTVSAVLTMALGIAGASTVFSVVDVFLFRRLPIPQPERVVMLGDVQGSTSALPATFTEFREWSEQLPGADALVAYFNFGMTYSSPDTADRVRVMRVSSGLFDLLGTEPFLGRTFTSADHALDAPLVAVVSHRFWKETLGGRRDAIGGRVMLDDHSYVVIGVANPRISLAPDPPVAWIPLEPTAPWRDGMSHYLVVLARLRAGVSLPAFQDEVRRATDHLREQNATAHGVIAVPLRQHLGGEWSSMFLSLLLAASMFLGISVANHAGLFHARVQSRLAELRLRRALGGSESRLARQILAESLILNVLGAVFGLAAAMFLLAQLDTFWPVSAPRPPVPLGLNDRTVTLAIGVAVCAAVLTALMSAASWRDGRAQCQGGHLGGSRAGPTGTRGALVFVQVALTVILLVCAGVTLKSLHRLLALDLGFSAARVVSARVSLPSARYADPSAQRDFYSRLLTAVRATPGVEDLGAIVNLPLVRGRNSGEFSIQGRSALPRDSVLLAERSIVTPGYFSTMGMKLHHGRFLDAGDTVGAGSVVVINESFARRFWPDGDAIGGLLGVPGDYTRWWRIVGIVNDRPIRNLGESPRLVVYVPFSQWPATDMALVIRTDFPDAVIRDLRRAARSLDQAVPIHGVQPYERVLYEAGQIRRAPARLLALFATLALALAGVGLYGLLAYDVQRRSSELAVRMAFGADLGAIVRLVVHGSLRVVIPALAVGALAALVVSDRLMALLNDDTVLDAAVYLKAALTVIAAALLASALPAVRATRVDAATQLRSD